MALKPCRECAREVSTEARACPHCGAPSPTSTPPTTNARGGRGGGSLVMPSEPPRDPGIVAFVSLLIPGLGQVMVGQTKKGFAVLGGSVLLAALTGFILMPFVWIAVAVDAYQAARTLKRGDPVDEWAFFPR